MAALVDKHVQCNNCKERYPILPNGTIPDAFGEYNQGRGCDADIGEDGVYGHYGSCIDDIANVIWVTEKPHHLVIGKQLCDGCIRGFLQSRVLLIHSQRRMHCSELVQCGCIKCYREIAHRIPDDAFYKACPDMLRCPCEQCRTLVADWKADQRRRAT